jgi:fatty acid amide hydrolase
MDDPTRLSLTELAARLRSRALSSAEAVEAHIRRIEAVDGRLNAVVVRRFEEARAEAKAKDSEAPRGPLHGVPITIKESYDVAGTPTTAGLVTRKNHRAPSDGPLVKKLRDAGAIVVGKTNVAQLLYFVESSNPLYGRVMNPWDPARTAGGSSGGEAAIVAAFGSPLGLGSDIGGSVRCPAHFCGVSALKPTAHRLPPLGSIDREISPQDAIVDSAGLIARHIDDLALAYDIVCVDDPLIPPVPRRPLEDVKGLKIGWYVDDGWAPASPALRRAVEEAARALESLGCELREFRVPAIEEATRVYTGLMGADGLDSLRALLGDGPIDPNIRVYLAVAGRGQRVRTRLADLAELAGQKKVAHGIRGFGRIDVPAYWRLLEDLRSYRKCFVTEMGDLDALLCPPMPTAAFPHGFNNRIGLLNHYCLLFNLLGMPAGVTAATRVRAGEESDRTTDRTIWRELPTRMLARAERGSVGLPAGVQIAARWWREDRVLALLRALEIHFRAQPDYPSAPPL